MTTRKDADNSDRLRHRYEFVGRIADEDVRKRYIDKSVASLFAAGEANPIKYIWGDHFISE